MMKRLAAMQDWPVLIVRAFTAVSDGVLEIRARHHDERIAAAEFEHTLLDLPRRATRHFAAGAFAAGQGDRFDARIIDDLRRLFRFDQQRLKNAFVETCATKNIFNRERALRNIGGVFEQADVAAIKAGAAKRKTCQKGKFHGMIASTGPIGSKRT